LIEDNAVKIPEMSVSHGLKRSHQHGLANIPTQLAILAFFASVGALYFAKAILMPIAVAIVLTFVLAPPVRLLRRWTLGRVPSVIIVVSLAFVIITGFGTFLGQQLTLLAAQVPQYQITSHEKIHNLRNSATRGGVFGRISNFLSTVNQEISSKQDKAATSSRPTERAPAPMPVEVHQPDPTPMEIVGRFAQPLLDPLTTTGLIAMFVIFFLLQREDLRDRLIRLAGSHDLQRTTAALNDGARRLSRYFLAQTGLNALFGVVVGTGLACIGVPNPVLWGILAMVLRFVPYIGAFFAAAFPVALAVAVDPGWTMVMWTIGLFLIVEPLVGQVLEPLVYGHSTGLTPVAVIIAATFWTWLWGPVGLLLSTPLTVCLGVLGRHVEGLQFLDIMIGSDAPLMTPAQSFYQRALAGDPDGVFEQAEEMLKRCSLWAYYDDIVLPGLMLAAVDVRRGALDDERVLEINEAVVALVNDLSDYEDSIPTPRKDKQLASHPEGERADALPRNLPILQAAELKGEWVAEKAILCVAGRGPFDYAAATILVQLLEKYGHGARIGLDGDVSASILRLDGKGVALVCFSHFDVDSSSTHLRYSMRRIRRRIPGAKILAGLWGAAMR
jgi:predicted PurR-regulated permease PerM